MKTLDVRIVERSLFSVIAIDVSTVKTITYVRSAIVRISIVISAITSL
jgi:hypothetical protein